MKNLICILFIIILSVADIFLFRKGILFAKPSLSIIPIFLFLIFTRKIQFYRGNKNSLIFFSIFLVLSLLFSFFSNYEEIGIKIALSVLSLLIYLATFNFFVDLKSKTISKIFILSIMLLGGSILYDLFFNISSVTRGAGFAENPNSSALRLNFMIVVLLNALTNKKQKIIVLVIGFSLVFLTLSRGGFILNLIIIFLSIANDNDVSKSKFHTIKFKIFKTVFKMFILGIFFSFVSIMLVKLIPSFQTVTTEQRINVFTGSESFVNDSDIEEGGRLYIINNYLKLIYDNPFGYGTGMSNNRDFFHASTHNMFLRFFIDFGILGFIVYLLFTTIGLKIAFNNRDVYYLMFFLLLINSSFLDNTLIENRSFIISLAVMDVFLVKNKLKGI